jgi:small-conductance mechanosensitive channel
VRASILLWSTASGLILGLFIDATLIGVALLLSAIVPGLSSRLHHRWLTIAALVVVAVIPLVLAVLGYLEGELKTV